MLFIVLCTYMYKLSIKYLISLEKMYRGFFDKDTQVELTVFVDSYFLEGKLCTKDLRTIQHNGI